MKEHEIERYFKRYSKKFIKLLGTKAQYADVLYGVGKEYFGKKWRGVYFQDNITLDRPGYYIINTHRKGVHWVACYLTNQTCYIYDSYGRPSSHLLKHLVKRLKNRKMVYKDSDTNDREQIAYDTKTKLSEVCGQLCLAFIQCVKEYGIRNAIKI